MHCLFGYNTGGWPRSGMRQQVSMTSCAIGDVHNAVPSKISTPGNTHDQTMYTRQVCMGNIQASNWHNVGTAWYHGLERHRRSYRAGMYQIEPTESTSQFPRSYWTWRTRSWPLVNFLDSSFIHLDIWSDLILVHLCTSLERLVAHSGSITETAMGRSAWIY